RLAWLLPLAFILRCSVAVLSSLAAIAPALYTLDAERYDTLGLMMVEAWKTGATMDPDLFSSINVKIYAGLCGAVYYSIGHSLLSMKILNCFAGALLVYNVFRITRALAGERAALGASMALTLFPSLVFWSSQNFREALVFYGISEIVYAHLQWSETGRVRWL